MSIFVNSKLIMLDIQRIVSGLLCSNMFIIEEGGHAIIIDPCEDLSLFKEDLVYDWIILTHEHYDHISGVNLWKNKTNARVLCSKKCAERIIDPALNMSRYFEVFASIQTMVPCTVEKHIEDYVCEADGTFEDRMLFEWMHHDVCLAAMPGHSAGCIGILIDDGILFSGDALFKDRETEYRFPGGSKKELCRTKEYLRSLRHDLLVYPGHFDRFSLQEVIDNGFL